MENSLNRLKDMIEKPDWNAYEKYALKYRIGITVDKSTFERFCKEYDSIQCPKRRSSENRFIIYLLDVYDEAKKAVKEAHK